MTMRKVTIALFFLFAARSGYGQTLSSNNIWTGTNTFNNGVYFGQGRPYWDVFAFSASGSNMNTTGTISAGTNVLTLGSAIDFQNKQGIAVYGAGSTSTLTAPGTLTGSQIAAVANLAPANSGIHGITCSGTTATATTLGFYGFPNSASVTIAGAAFSQYNIATTLTALNAYQFTYPIASCPGNSDGGTVTLGTTGSKTFKYEIVAEDANSGYSPASATVTISSAYALSFEVANHLTWGTVTGATQYLVYGDRGSGGALTCIGPAAAPPSGGVSPAYDDYGSTSLSCPVNAPTNPPSVATPQILITTISSGAGTTSLTLGASASNTATSQRIEHDDTVAINACTSAAASEVFSAFGGGGHCFLPLGTYNFQTLLFPTTTPTGSSPMLIEFNGILIPRQPIVIGSQSASVSSYKLLGGQGGQSTSFGTNNLASIGATGLNPIIEITGPSTDTNNFEKIGMSYCPGDCIRIDATTGGGPSATYFTDVSVGTQTGSPGSALKIASPQSGFGVYIQRGVLSSNGPGASFDISNYGGITMRGTNLVGQGIYARTNDGQDIGSYKFEESIYESGNSPFLTIDCTVGSGGGRDIQMNFAFPSDPVTGQDVGLFRGKCTSAVIAGVRIEEAEVGSNGYPFNQIMEGVGVSGYHVTCGLRTSGCTGLAQMWHEFNSAEWDGYVPSGFFEDNQGAIYIAGNDGGNPAVHIITNSNAGDAISVENPLNTKLFRVDKNGNAVGNNIGILASLTTTAATSDNVTVAGATSSSHCFLTPTNASAATNIAKTYISSKTTNQITVAHITTSGMTYDISCTPN
jgi:hypothetical protein